MESIGSKLEGPGNNCPNRNKLHAIIDHFGFTKFGGVLPVAITIHIQSASGYKNPEAINIILIGVLSWYLRKIQTSN